jgi:formaldehyde-activating enzyme
MYNIPMTTDSYIPRRVIEDLADIGNIVGLKDSSGNLTYTLEILEKVRNKIDVAIGHDEVVLPALASGCSGMILASAQVFPEIWQRVFKAVKENDLETARELQMNVQKLSRIFCRYGGPVPVKAALRMMGLKCGRARKPLMEGGVLIHEDREEIRLELEKLGKIEPKSYDVKPSSGLVEGSFEDIGLSVKEIQDSHIQVARAASGEGREGVQVDLVSGKKTSALGLVFATQLTHPRHGFEALTTILEPNLTVRPSSLIIPAVELKNLRQANMIYGPTQSAVAKAIVDNIEQGVIPKEIIDDNLMIFKIFVHPSSLDRQVLYKNNYKAVDKAIKNIYGADKGVN